MTGQPDQPTLPETTDSTALETDRRLPSQRPHPVADATVGRAAQDDMRQAERHSGDSVQEQLIARLWRLPPGHPSSPYDADGRLRPPVPDWRELGRAQPNKETLEEAALSQTGDASSPELDPPENRRTKRLDSSGGKADSGQEEARKAWWDAVPGLHDLWQKHEEKWPEDKHPSADRSNDEPGSWRGDSGFTLNQEDNKHVANEYRQVAKTEEKITADMMILEQRSLGQLVGLDYRLKAEDRYKEKVAMQKTINPDADVHEVVAAVRDGVRYTLQYDEADYTTGVLSDVEALKDSGFEFLKLKNLWEAPEYKGINSQWREPEKGQAFEVQFHTPISFEAKQLTHGAYERLRTMDPTDDSRKQESRELHDFQRMVCTIIPIPPGVLDIHDHPQREAK